MLIYVKCLCRYQVLGGRDAIERPREEKVTRALLPHVRLSVLSPRPLTRAVQH